jgi:hypothetical protein
MDMEETAAKLPQESKPVQGLNLERDSDFTNLYANFIQSEMSVWDLKVLFGILDQSTQPNKVVLHTAINLPWTQVKLASYYLQVAVALHEAQNAKINIPPSLRPKDPKNIDNPDLDALSPEVKAKIATLYQIFIASL